MLHVALWEPEIPPNTGNVARLCAATDTALHLIGRLGFRIDDRSLKRAGLDYWPAVQMVQHADQVAFESAWTGGTIWVFSAHAQRSYTQAHFADGDCLLFGSESRGLPDSVRERHADTLVTIPMPDGRAQPQPRHGRRHCAV
jgi:tRNA (cytidine/uridine-2'-O-)-methyltransferase